MDRRSNTLNIKFSSDETSTSRISSSGTENHNQSRSYWIPATIKKRICVKFVKDREEICFCGRQRHDHIERYPIDIQAPWTLENNTEANTETDAYGEIEFIDECSGNISKYVRMDVNTDMQVVVNLLMKTWKLYRPNLIISVTGGAQAFDMNFKLKKLFRKGLMKAALGTDAWIITGGMNAGVMRHVGEAVRDYADSLKQPIVCLGIAPWGCVAKKEDLINSDGKSPAIYKTETLLKENGNCYIDPNHTHFLFVDDGTYEKYGSEITFRAKVESEISKCKKDADCTVDFAHIPMCCVVLEGGPGTLKTVYSSLSVGTPVVIINGSGRIANVLSNTLDKMKNSTSSESTEKIIKKELANERMDQDGLVELVKECCIRKELITVVNFLDDREELDVAILKALFTANKAAVVDQIQLCLVWNRLDIAKSDLSIEDKKFETTQLVKMFYASLVCDRSDFAKLFIDIGVSLHSFAQNELVQLYKETSSEIHLFQPSSNSKLHILQYVDRFVKKYMGPFYQPIYIKNRYETSNGIDSVNAVITRQCSDNGESPVARDYLDDPVFELFLWSLLLKRQKISLIFLEHLKEPIAAALMASHLLRRFASKTFDMEIKNDFLENSRNFETIAIGILRECYLCDINKAQMALIRSSSCAGNVSCLTLAEKAKNHSFISQSACQTLLTNIWYGALSSENNCFLIFLLYFGILFFPILPIIFPLIKFLKKCEIENDVTFLKSYQDTTLCQKIFHFLNAPVIKFVNHSLFYILFLLLFSYTMLCNFKPHISKHEIFLYIWIFSLAVEEVHELTHSEEGSFKLKFHEYVNDLWNICDILCILLFIVAAILRLFEDDSLFESARIIFAFSLLLACLRTLHFFSVMKQLGPKLLMIRRMTIDMLYFIAILIIFIAAYGVALNVILYPNASLDWNLVTSILHKPYFQMYGELFLDEMNSSNQCDGNSNGTMSNCFSVGRRWITPIMLGVYIMMTNLLMFNLLIAMFSFSFNKINENSNNLWRFQRLNLIKEFYNKPLLPPPFNWILVFNRLWSIKRIKGFDEKFSNTKNKQFMTWESRRAEDYFKMEVDNANHSTEHHLHQLLEGVNILLCNKVRRSRLISYKNENQDDVVSNHEFMHDY